MHKLKIQPADAILNPQFPQCWDVALGNGVQLSHIVFHTVLLTNDYAQAPKAFPTRPMTEITLGPGRVVRGPSELLGVSSTGIYLVGFIHLLIKGSRLMTETMMRHCAPAVGAIILSIFGILSML